MIAGKLAVLKENTSVEYVSENRFFTDADDYTLSISLPLAGCPENVDIFGRLTRKDVDNPKSVMDAELRAGGFVRRGVVAITEITHSEVKVQFLAGRTSQNYAMELDEVMINELDLGDPSSTRPADWTVKAAWGLDSAAANYRKYVAIPWVNNSTGNVQNDVVFKEQSGVYWTECYEWGAEVKGLSFMPFMIEIARKAAEQTGFTADFSAWEASPWISLLCCSALPYAWGMPAFAKALPRWSVSELFLQLERLMQCEFDFDFENRRVTMSFTSDRRNSIGAVQIDDVVDEHTVEVESPLKSANVDKPYLFTYGSGNGSVWNRYTCDWLVRKYWMWIRRVDSDAEWAEIWAEYTSDMTYYRMAGGMDVEDFMKYNPCEYIFEYMGTYFIVEWGEILSENSVPGKVEVVDGNTYVVEYSSYYVISRKIVPIAMFAPWLSDDESEAAETIEILPAILDDTDMGKCVFLECGELDSSESEGLVVGGHPESGSAIVTGKFQYSESIAAGEQSNEKEYVSGLSVAFLPEEVNSHDEGKYRCPTVDWVRVNPDGIVAYDRTVPRGGLRLQRRKYADDIEWDNIELTQKYTFKFLSRELPDPGAIFYIRGKRYVCESLTATLSIRGMSELFKGTFYRITE